MLVSLMFGPLSLIGHNLVCSCALPSQPLCNIFSPFCSVQAFAEEVTNLLKQDVAPEQLMDKLVQVQNCRLQAC